jgi:hypothetical protein
LKAIKFNIRTVKTAVSEIFIRRNCVRKPSDNNSLFASICANRIAIGNVVNNRRKPRAKIEIIHKRSIYGLNERTHRGVPYRFAVTTAFGCPLGFD